MQKRRHVSLNALRAFEAAGRLGRMTRAADELSVTHGAVSRQIRHLEAGLGVTLFTGPKNRLTLTPEGTKLLPELTAAFDRIEKAVHAAAYEQIFTVDVSCLGTFTLRWLIPRLYRFQARHPEIEVRLTAADTPVNFETNCYDVAIRVSDHAFPTESEVIELFPEHIGPVGSAKIFSSHKLVTYLGLLTYPLLHTATRINAWDQWFKTVGIKHAVPNGQKFEHFYFMQEAALSGLGVALVPWQLAQDDVIANRLIAPFGFVASGLNYVAVVRRQREKRVIDFCSWLAEEANATLIAPVETLS